MIVLPSSDRASSFSLLKLWLVFVVMPKQKQKTFGCNMNFPIVQERLLGLLLRQRQNIIFAARYMAGQRRGCRVGEAIAAEKDYLCL
jgi:hypothetical protein